jgi:hypothetical protein
VGPRQVLTFEEIERLADLRRALRGRRPAADGRQPTVRAHLPVLVGKLAELRVPRLASNGGKAPRSPDHQRRRSDWSLTSLRPGSTG